MCVCVQTSAYINIERLCIKYMHSNTCIYFFFLLLLVCSCAQLSFLNISSAKDLLRSSWNKSLRHTYTGIVVGHKCLGDAPAAQPVLPCPGGFAGAAGRPALVQNERFALKRGSLRRRAQALSQQAVVSVTQLRFLRELRARRAGRLDEGWVWV